MSFSPKNLILLGLAAILLIAIPLTVFLAQKQQETRSGAAAPFSRLTFDKESNTVSLNDTVSLDVKLDPGQGDTKNLVGEMQLTINYDADKLELTDTKFTPNQNVISESTTPEYPTPVNGIGTIIVDMKTATTCDNISCEISANTTIATLKFKAIKVTGDTPAKVSFDPDPTKTILLSGGGETGAGDNVLLSAGEANIIVTDATTVSPTLSPTSTPTPTATPAGPANQNPVCSNISLDKAAAGTAPYALTFTAAGTDSDGTISKATFSFGDGITQDVTEGGGIGTSTTSAQLAHTYSTAGTFNASITFTDNAAGVSPACSQTVTISGSAEPTAPPVATATPIPTLAPTGPAETLMGIGAFGILFTIIGAAVLLIL